MRLLSRSLRFALAFSLAAPAAADVLAQGFAPTTEAQPGGVTRTLSNGDILSFDGSAVTRYDAGGAFLETVYTLPGSFFSGCFAVNPSETRAVVGESSNGDLYDVDLVAGGGVFVANLSFNFDAVFEDDANVLVSAATCGFGCGNDLVRVDLDTAAVTFLASVAGASGPVTVAEDGDLFYGSVSGAFPAPEGAASILRFDAADLTGTPLLDDSDAAVVADGFDGASALAYDAETGRVFLAENNFSSGLNRLLAIEAATGETTTLVDGDTFNFLNNVEFLGGAGDGVFFPFQPDDNGRLFYSRTDFGALDERVAVEPARPTLTLSGPGTNGGSGLVHLDVAGGPSGGFAVLMYAPLGDVAPTESAFWVDGLPLVHTALDPLAIQFLPAVLALDGDGAGTTGFLNNAGLVDAFGMQALVASSDPALVGSTTTDTL